MTDASSSPEPIDLDANDNAPSSAKKRKVTAAEDEIEVDVTAPEPPSKRAKRALKKGKDPTAKKAKRDDRDLDGDDEDAKGDAEKPRSEHGVWVGNLPFEVNGQRLRKWFVENSGGVITEEAITRVKLPMVKGPKRDPKAGPANKGFAYVDFADLATKVAAVALSENDIGGRKLLIKDSKSFEGRPKKEKQSEAGDGADGAEGTSDGPGQNASRKVFVGNMSFQTTEGDLKRNFEKCGEIELIKVATFEDSGKCKGYGWITFKEPAGAAWAVKGFVKVKEAVETEEDFDDEGAEKDESKQKQFKTRKWWVNRLHGRELKLELAEDDLVRYNKRFKGGAKRANGENGAPRSRQQRGERDEDRKPAAEGELNVARLTGNLVKHTGTKVSFD